MNDSIRPAIGSRVMWRYGTKDYANYGEVGTVTSVHDTGHITVTMDDEQPFHRAMFGAKSKRTGHTRVCEFRDSEVESLADAYRDTAERLRRVAKGWEDEANAVDAYQAGTWCGECAYGVVNDPPCCTQPELTPASSLPERSPE